MVNNLFVHDCVSKGPLVASSLFSPVTIPGRRDVNSLQLWVKCRNNNMEMNHEWFVLSLWNIFSRVELSYKWFSNSSSLNHQHHQQQKQHPGHSTVGKNNRMCWAKMLAGTYYDTIKSTRPLIVSHGWNIPSDRLNSCAHIKGWMWDEEHCRRKFIHTNISFSSG